ncbi:uncharacterized protein LOC118647954 [Monomorium pharaonis]|uniref:uncharacterized protein LOC118647954 n=1 Tax=Monomorium pharaonis TaxID=307658 RepID=UPI00174789BD|nr:uncharacterized protein LOC118647954 [Monomorium pharaonis]XP_036149953.1 uncharacterized protein LOC118647954 [Monomorium pharaonis]
MTVSLTNTSVTDISDKKNIIKEYKDINPNRYVYYRISNILKWPNYYWFGSGFGFGVLIMLIINSNLYCHFWCPNARISRCICNCLRILWHRFGIWFHHFCLCKSREQEYFFPRSEQNIGIITRQRRLSSPEINRIITRQGNINIYNIPPLPRVSRHKNESRSSQQSQQSTFISQELQTSQQSQLPLPVSQQSYIPPKLPLVSVPQRLPVNTSPAPITPSPTATIVRTTTPIKTMIATSTSTNSSVVDPEEYINPLFKC